MYYQIFFAPRLWRDSGRGCLTNYQLVRTDPVKYVCMEHLVYWFYGLLAGKLAFLYYSWTAYAVRRDRMNSLTADLKTELYRYTKLSHTDSRMALHRTLRYWSEYQRRHFPRLRMGDVVRSQLEPVLQGRRRKGCPTGVCLDAICESQNQLSHQWVMVLHWLDQLWRLHWF